jgi:predicted MFS family arabinose efflux permease
MERAEATIDPALQRPRRWAVLAAFVGVAGVSQMLWLNFAPILTQVQARYGVSESTAVFGLVACFPLLYVLLSVHAGGLTDRRGYRFTVGLGAWIMAAFACVRLAEGSFAALVAGQVGIAVAQPYVVNGITKLVTDWFTEGEGAIATGLGTMGMFIGMALAMVLTPKIFAASGMRVTMLIFAAIAVAAAGAFTAVVHPNAQRAAAAEEGAPARFRTLLRDRRLIILCTLGFLGLGVFNGLTGLLEPMLAPHGIDSEHAGTIGGVLIGGGIVGAVIIPLLSDLTRRRKPFLLLCAAGALATIYTLGTSSSYAVLLTMAGLHGFFFMPALALLLEMCAQIVGARSAGAATALVMLTGNAGGVIVLATMDALKQGKDYHPSVLLMVALLALTLALATVAPETFPRRAAGAS